MTTSVAPPVVQSASVDYGWPIGTFTFDKGGISGKPFPSEGQAWSFEKGLQVMSKFLVMGHDKQLAMLKELGL